MKPLAVVLVFNLFPMLVKAIKAVMGTNELLERYFAWTDRFKRRKDAWNRAAWCAAFHAPALLAANVGAILCVCNSRTPIPQ